MYMIAANAWLRRKGRIMKALVKKLWAFVNPYLLPLCIPAAYYLMLMLWMPQRITLGNARYYVVQAVMPAVLAWGASFSLTVGHRDFSIGASVLAAAIIGGNLALGWGLGIPGLILLCPLVGLLTSSITGGLFVLLKIPSMIVSIGVMLVVESLCGIVFGGDGVFLPKQYVVFAGSGKTLIFGLCVFLLAYVLYNHTSYGYHVRAIGSNCAVASTRGLNVPRVRFWCFALSGLFAGFYAVLLLGTTSVQRSVNAMGTRKTAFDGMMCFCVGLAVAPRANPIPSIFIGSLYMQLVQLTLAVANFPSTFTQSVVALFVLAVMCYSARKQLSGMRRAHRRECVEIQRQEDEKGIGKV